PTWSAGATARVPRLRRSATDPGGGREPAWRDHVRRPATSRGVDTTGQGWVHEYPTPRRLDADTSRELPKRTRGLPQVATGDAAGVWIGPGIPSGGLLYRTAMSPDEAIAAARGGRLLPVYLLVGEERLWLDRVVRALKEATLAGGVAGLNEDQLTAGEVDADA